MEAAWQEAIPFLLSLSLLRAAGSRLRGVRPTSHNQEPFKTMQDGATATEGPIFFFSFFSSLPLPTSLFLVALAPRRCPAPAADRATASRNSTPRSSRHRWRNGEQQAFFFFFFSFFFPLFPVPLSFCLSHRPSTSGQPFRSGSRMTQRPEPYRSCHFPLPLPFPPSFPSSRWADCRDERVKKVVIGKGERFPPFLIGRCRERVADAREGLDMRSDGRDCRRLFFSFLLLPVSSASFRCGR